MATVSAVVLTYNQKQDGTFPVNIRLGHGGKSVYMETPHFVIKSQLDKKGKIKDKSLLDLINPQLADYRRQISELAPFIDGLTAKELKERLLKKKDEVKTINVVGFGRQYVERLKAAGKKGTASTIQAVVNNLADYFKADFVNINDITSKFLNEYEAYLRTDRKQTRVNQFGRPVTTTAKGLGDSGIHGHMRDFRVLFNVIRDEYNDEDRGIMIVKHYPFKKYKVKPAPITEKQALEIGVIRSIRDLDIEGGRGELAKDMFMLSFYLCGMNGADIYGVNAMSKNGRVEYERAKTKGKRKDNAFISVAVTPEAKKILDKYKGTLQRRYVDIKGFNKALNLGLKQIAEKLELPEFDFYAARHSFATIARNDCRFSLDDVAAALNHLDRNNRITDIYIKKDWKIVDDVQKGVIDLLNR